MGSFPISMKRTFHEEDSTMSGKITFDKGLQTRYGISLRFLRDCGIDLSDLDRDGITLEHVGDLNNDGRVDLEDMRLMTPQVAERLYFKYFWSPLRLDLVEPQYLADQMFDIAVNMGPKVAGKLLQKAVCQYGIPLKVDGVVGMQTLRAVESCSMKSKLNNMIVDYRLVRYSQIVKDDPAQKVNLKGWKLRAARFTV
jgi:lysozyme family protein